ncbi:hypothetical protein NEOLEDRAFT_1239376 [Neolentinus lepideus HHB14362 ss-1]|uniref:DNA damage-binding protein 1 n=1 Tax=Neolentinus lepideus HHB14362 ss-1 TaxID=1314782 RepID=A0A165UYN3_9AGAM|nr:hypothetical protein NEOLEDRAFT_1239376 [Neolentinus lepideus HHB14362 ss-1]
MRVVTTFHPPSSVVASVGCRLSTDIEHLVLAKPDRIEVHSLHEDGPRHECSLEIWGRVLAVKELPRYGSTYSNVIVLTDHPDPRLYVLSLSTSSAGQAELRVDKSLTLSERFATVQETFTDVLVHPEGQVAVATCYAGKLKVVSFDNGTYQSDFDAQFPELNLLSMCFLPTSSDTHCLALLAVTHEGKLQLLSRDVSLSDYEIFSTPSTLLPATTLSSSTFLTIDPPPILIPIPPSPNHESGTEEGFGGGVLVVGGRKVLFYELASQDLQDRHKGKRRRLEGKKRSENKSEKERAREVEKARERKRRKPRAAVEWPWSEVTAWCNVDEEGRRVLLGDRFGRLALLSVDTEQSTLILLPLGQTSPPKSLTYLTSQTLFLGSHFGDSQLLRIHTSPISSVDTDTLPIPPKIPSISPSELLSATRTSGKKGKGKAEEGDVSGYVVRTKGGFVEEMMNWTNVAPILDAVLVDLEDSGQTTIVTCSGGRNTGSLKVIRNGADFNEVAALRGLGNVTGVWPLRSRFADSLHSHILVTTPIGTHILRVDDSETFTHLSSSTSGFITDTRTLAVANVARRTRKNGQSGSSYTDSAFVVQVTPAKVALLEFDEALQTFSATGELWTPQFEGPTGRYSEIVAASVNASQVVLGLNGGKVVVLNLGEDNRFNLAGHRSFEAGAEIAAISCLPMDSSKYYATQVAVAFWDTNEVKILSITSAQSYLTPVCTTGSLPSLPRSLLLHNFSLSSSATREWQDLSHLLVGLADGTALAYVYKDATLSEKRVFSFGSGPVTLTPCKVDGKRGVFACASRAGVVFWDKGRLQTAPMLVKGVVAMAPLNTDYFRSSIVLATNSGLTIGDMGHLDKMHIRSFVFGLDNPYRIVHHAMSKVFAVACTRTEPRRVGDFTREWGVLKLMDDATFEVLAEFECDAEEQITSLEIYDNDIIQQPCFCVGTVNLRDEKEPTSGRLLLLCSDVGSERVASNRSLYLAAASQIKGCISALAKTGDMIAAAVNSAVVLYRLEPSTTGILTHDLEYVNEWNHDYVLSSIVPGLNGLVISDAISSVSILDVKDSKLQRRAKDYSPLWPVAIQAMDDKSVIAANVDCNLYTFSLQREQQGRMVLQKDGAFHLGDLVNKFIPGSLSSSTESSGEIPIEPRQLFFTASGRIGMVFEMGNELSLHMTGLERNMASVLLGSGGVSHSDWRTPVIPRSRVNMPQLSYGFLDGDFLEQYLAFSRDPSPSSKQVIKKIMSGTVEAETLKLTASEIDHILEKLQSMH